MNTLFILIMILIFLLFITQTQKTILSKKVEKKYTPLSATGSIIEFINNFKKEYDKENRELPLIFHISISGLETGNGKNVYNYNLYNIKYNDGNYNYYVNELVKTESNKFRAYNNFNESIKDFEKLITQSSRYKKTYELIKMNKIKEAIEELINSGYSTSDSLRYVNYFNNISKYV